MAERRMFAKTIIDSDAFLDMPHTTQLLYFHLSMRADDDGFINNPKSIIRNARCTEDDMKVLISKKFVIPFESGVVVIKHWKIHNYIRNDRYKETKYKDEKASLAIDENNAYTQHVQGVQIQMSTVGIPSDNQMDTQVRLGKDSIGKYNNISCAEEPHEMEKEEQLKRDFEIIYAIYPKKVGKTVAFANYKLWVSKKGKNVGGKNYRLTNKQIYKAVKKYVTQQEQAGKELEYWKNFDTLMSRQLLDYVELEEK